MLGWNDALDWLSVGEMEDLLEQNSYPVDPPLVGDIVVWRGDHYGCDGELMHTAVITKIKGKRIMVIQKGGPLDLSTAWTDEVWDGYGTVTEYRRSSVV